MWCPYNAGLIDLPPVVSVDEIFGASMPDEVFESFIGKRDASGRADVFEVDRCPLQMVDSASPKFDAEWLDDIGDYSRMLAAELPASWLPSNPSTCLTEGLTLLRSEVDRAGMFRSKNDESW